MAPYFRTRLRDLLPLRHQVPAKYWYGKLRGTLEPEMRYLDVLVPGGAHVVDVGGNRGTYAYRLWQLGCSVDVFEPHPGCCRVLAAWGSDKRTVRIHEVALSSESGEVSLRIPVDEAGVEHDASASIEPNRSGRARCEQVATTTLDSFAFDDLSLVKVDVEGHEASVLRGARQTLERSKPALLLEIEQRHLGCPIRQVFESVEAQGYRGFFHDDDRLRNLESFDPQADQRSTSFGQPGARYINNFLFLHRDRLGSGAYAALRLPVP